MSDENDRQTLSSVHNALRILKEFTHERVLGVTELSRRLDIGKSTAHRLLSTLVSEGFVERTPDGQYALGITLWELGSLMVHRLELRDVAHPVLAALRTETGETVHMAVLDGTDVVYIDRFESPATLQLFRRIGYRMPAHSTSTGKAILAFSPPEVVERVIAAGLRRLAAGTVTSPGAFRANLKAIRERGYVISIQESEDGVASVGAPIFDHTGAAAGAVSVAGPITRVQPRLEALGEQVREAVDEISRRMGYLPQQAWGQR